MVKKHEYAAYRQIVIKGTNAHYKKAVERIVRNTEPYPWVEVEGVGGRTVQFTFAIAVPKTPQQVLAAKQQNEEKANLIMGEIERHLKASEVFVERKKKREFN